VFPLFPRDEIKDMFPSMMPGETEHYCAFALPEHGSITFFSNLINTLQAPYKGRDYNNFADMLDERPLRVKAYYTLLHFMKSCGSDFKFTDKVAAIAKIRDIFSSFSFISDKIEQWGEKGIVRQAKVAGEHVERFNPSEFNREISSLRIEASFILDVPNNGLDVEELLTSMQSILTKDINLFFGHDYTKEVFTNVLSFMPMKDWQAQVRDVRKMIWTSKGGKDGINLMLPKNGWRTMTTRGKQQAECLQSLLGFCSKKMNSAVRSRSWAIVWNNNAEKDYEGMSLDLKFNLDMK
jgi:hypothetical protein